MNLYHKGKPLAEIQQTIDSSYARKYKTRTPPPKPPEPKKQ